MRSAEYDTETKQLAADPIIQQLYLEMPDELKDELAEGGEDAVDWPLLQGVSEEYRNRGGQNAHSVGGPSRALVALAQAAANAGSVR